MSERVLHLDVVVYKEDDLFVAHCLQLDLVTTAKTIEQACCDIEDVIKTHITYAIENDNLENLLKPAPPEIWNLLLKTNIVAEGSIKRWELPKMPPNVEHVEIQGLCA